MRISTGRSGSPSGLAKELVECRGRICVLLRASLPTYITPATAALDVRPKSDKEANDLTIVVRRHLVEKRDRREVMYPTIRVGAIA